MSTWSTDGEPLLPEEYTISADGVTNTYTVRAKKDILLGEDGLRLLCTEEGIESNIELAAVEAENPTEPTDPTDDGELCEKCGTKHSGGFFGRIICFFRRIVNWFRNLFR